MKNDEFLIKIETIIKYLKENDGYNYKLYNLTCPNSNNYPNSNIVEYAEDIRDYWKDIKYNENLESYIITEICEIIMDNLKLFTLSDSKLTNLKKYCKDRINESIIKPTPNKLLIEFTKEALLDLLTDSVLYDFRNIE